MLKNKCVNELANQLTSFSLQSNFLFHFSGTCTNENPIKELFLNGSYQENNPPFFNNYEGNWSLAFWNNQELIIARDKMGNKRIYYYDCDEYLIFSTHLNHLLALSFIPKELNANVLIQCSTNHKTDGQTLYKNINQLPKAHYITINSNNKLNLHCYWIPKIKTSIYYKNFEDYTEHFNHIYTQAVTDSLLGFKKPSVALSSGLDSSSTYAIAASILKKREENIETVTWKTDIIDQNLSIANRTNDETELVKKLTEKSSNTNSHIVTSTNNNILTFYKKQLKNCHQPIFNLLPHMMEVFEKGQELGVDVMLNGFGGNFTVSHTGFPYFNPLDLKSTASFIKKQIKDTVFFSKANNNLNRAHIRQEAIEENIDDFFYLTPHLEQKRKKGKEDRYKHIINILQSNTIQDISLYTETLGFESRVPVLDNRVIDFCFSIPNEIFYKNDVNKRLLKHAMRNKLPNDILYNKKRGLQGTNYVNKFRSEAKDIFNLFAEFKQSKLISYWLDVDLIIESFKIFINPNTTRKVFNEKANIQIILRGIQLGLFLQKFENGDY